MSGARHAELLSLRRDPVHGLLGSHGVLRDAMGNPRHPSPLRLWPRLPDQLRPRHLRAACQPRRGHALDAARRAKASARTMPNRCRGRPSHDQPARVAVPAARALDRAAWLRAGGGTDAHARHHARAMLRRTNISDEQIAATEHALATRQPRRFVSLWWESAGDELAFSDRVASGAGQLAHWPYLDYMHSRGQGFGPIYGWLVEHQVDLGSSEAPATHALVLDRDTSQAWVGPVVLANAIVHNQRLTDPVRLARSRMTRAAAVQCGPVQPSLGHASGSYPDHAHVAARTSAAFAHRGQHNEPGTTAAEGETAARRGAAATLARLTAASRPAASPTPARGTAVRT
jgi:hypothetical protein